MTSIPVLKLAALMLAGAAAAASAPAGSAGPPPSAHSSEPAAAAHGQANAGKAETAIAMKVSNPLSLPRARETIVVALAEILKMVPAFDVKKVQVLDATGKEILSQLVDMDGDESPDELAFQTDRDAKQTKVFKLKVGQRHSAAREDYKVFGRFVRERHDDFAWENDLVAHRVYGPDLETCPKEPLTSSGVDTWVKRVSKLVVNDWYMTDNYHQDMGEGADFYAVGKSRGLGGLGVWADGKLHVSKNFTNSRVLASGPIRLVFELRYAPWEAGGIQVGETKRVILDAGTPFNRFESTFTGQALAVGVGIAKHAGSAVKTDARAGSMRVWEPLDGGKAGNLGTAVVFPAGARVEEHHTDLDYLVVAKVPSGSRLVYYAGSTWDRAGRIRDAAAWTAEVQNMVSRMSAPVKVSLRIDQ
jgi:hypothetical protein